MVETPLLLLARRPLCHLAVFCVVLVEIRAARPSVAAHVEPEAFAENYKGGLEESSFTATTSKASKEFLYFAPVKSDPAVMSLIKENVRNLRSTFGNDQVDVFLAHYDENSAHWKARDEAWYTNNVQFHADEKGTRKFILAKKLFKNFDLSPYKWVWMADEDLDTHGTDLRTMVDLAHASKAVINLPAFTQLHGSSFVHHFQAPQAECRYRLTEIVELLFPFFRPAALHAFLYQCDGCIGEEMTNGGDNVWCRFVRSKLQLKDFACSVIDATPVVHADFRTIPGKYVIPDRNSDDRHRRGDFLDKMNEQIMAVKAKHPDWWVEWKNHTERCMGADGHFRERQYVE